MCSSIFAVIILHKYELNHEYLKRSDETLNTCFVIHVSIYYRENDTPKCKQRSDVKWLARRTHKVTGKHMDLSELQKILHKPWEKDSVTMRTLLQHIVQPAMIKC